MLNFAVDTHEEGERVRRASAVLREVVAAESPGQFDVAALTVAHPCRVEAISSEKCSTAWAFSTARPSGLVAAHTPEGEITSVLAEVALPMRFGPSTRRIAATLHLLDARPVGDRIRRCRTRHRRAAATVGVRRLRCFRPTGNARYCLTGSPAPCRVEARPTLSSWMPRCGRDEGRRIAALRAVPPKVKPRQGFSTSDC